ncbi:pitrilysin family protein [uncultured Holdemanella sp.]|uniref:M16 family metallopeptidase n=1 Tax=uncultured Holdemanella sp. TaxID=1763549 RepID=UPI0025F1CC07|nr:insulinase family protein [uncultured Holdemanella sp.]
MNYIQTQKFSDVYVSCKTMMPFNRNTITALNVLVYMMKAKTQKMNSKQKLASTLNLAYGTKVSYGLTSYGDIVTLDVRFQFVRPDWIEDASYLNKVKQIMDQVLFHSVLDEENFNESIYLLKNRLLAQMDDPANLSCMYAFEMAHDKHSISIPVQGDLKDLHTLTLEDVQAVYELYMDMAKHFYVCGYVTQELYDYIDSLDSHCAFISERTLLPRVESSYKIYEKNISQTYISQVYSTGVDISSDDYEAQCLLCSVLGQSQKNLLFDEIREKNSLCYSISSSLIRFDGALLIHTGVNRKDVNKVLNLIETQMDRLLNMDYDDRYLEIAKMDFKNRIISGLDHPLSLIAQAFLDDLLHRDITTQQRIGRIMQVTKEDISRVALRMNLASVAIVAESKNEL